MIKNLVTIALRILYRYKFFSLINIFGLTLGITCSLLIFTSVRFELSYDRFHENRDHLFVLEQVMELGTGPYRTDRCGPACGPALKDEFPEIRDYIRFSEHLEALMIYDESDSEDDPDRKNFIETAILPVDPNFLDHFSFTTIEGNASVALEDPWSIVLTETTAKKYFGENPAIGKILNMDQEYQFTVTAVLEDPPENSSIQFDFLVNFSFLEKLGHSFENFNGNPYFTFLRLDNPDLADGLAPGISEFLDEHQSEEIPADQSLVSLTDYHQHGEQRGRIFTTVLTILAIVILSIACINFMNLTTARFLNRTREVGIRKVVGARQPQLIRQFIGETMIIVFISIILSILAVDAVLPVYNRQFESNLVFHLTDPVILLGILSVFLLTSLLAGSYPAFFLSSIKVINVFGKFSGSRKRGGGIRRALVVLQFTFTVIFIIATIVNQRQFQHLKESNPEFNSEDIIYLPIRGNLNNQLSEVKQELLLNPSVVSVTAAAYVPRFVEHGNLEWGKTSDERNEIALVYPVGYDFEQTFDIELEEGRFYQKEMSADTANTIIINRSVAEVLGYDDPIGNVFYLNEIAYNIIGVTKNYIFNPLALGGDKVIMPFSDSPAFLFVETDLADKKPVIDYMEKVHEKFNPDFPYTPLYLEEFMDPVTEGLGQVNKILYFFTIFGIIISCMGLLGLSIFTTAQRTKEIGIRKAVGASGIKILNLVVMDFMKLILISLVIAIPSTIFLVNLMLKQFAQRISLGPGIFLLAALIMILIALITVGYQAIRSASSNPADSLRYE